jgi:hypothetical protein
VCRSRTWRTRPSKDAARSYVKKCQPTGYTTRRTDLLHPSSCRSGADECRRQAEGSRPRALGALLFASAAPHSLQMSRPRHTVTLNQSQIDRFDAIQLHLSGLSEALMRFAARCADSRCVPIDKIAHHFALYLLANDCFKII